MWDESGNSVCECECIEGLRRALPHHRTLRPLADLFLSAAPLWTSAKGDWMCSSRSSGEDERRPMNSL